MCDLFFFQIYASPVNCLILCSSSSRHIRSVSSFSATIYPSSPCTITFFS